MNPFPHDHARSDKPCNGRQQATGKQAPEAVEALVALVANRFGEEE